MGYGNLGDAATQDVVIANIKERLPDVQFVAFSLAPGDTQERHGIPCYPLRRWLYSPSQTEDHSNGHSNGQPHLKSKLKKQLAKFPLLHSCAKRALNYGREVAFCARSYWILRGTDILVISGGGQLDDLWDGPWLQVYTVFKFSLLAKLANRKLYFLNVGVGQLKHPLSRFFARWAVQLADYRSFRDLDSQERLKSFGLSLNALTHVYPDSVYGLKIGHASNGPLRPSCAPVVGLNPTGYGDPRIWPHKDNSAYQHYIEKLTRFTKSLLDQGYLVRVFSTDYSVDRYAIKDLRDALSAILPSPELLDQTFPPCSASVKDVIRQISDFDFVVTSKYHGIVFSHVLGKPVLSLSYHRKMEVAMQSVGHGRFCANIANFTFDWLTHAFSSLVAESDNLKASFAVAVNANATQLSMQFDNLFPPRNR